MKNALFWAVVMCAVVLVYMALKSARVTPKHGQASVASVNAISAYAISALSSPSQNLPSRNLPGVMP
jgi:hypothetical protein